MTRFPLAILALALLGAIAACSGDDDDGDSRCAESRITYEGYATDETCVTMLDAEDAGAVQFDEPETAVMITPTNGASVSGSATSLIIQWDSPLDLDATFTRAPARAGASVWSRLAAFLSPVSVASAHEPPVTGAIHMVRVKDDGGDTLETWITSRENIVVSGEVLAGILSRVSNTLAIEVTSMYVTENRIVNAGTDGPFRASSDAVVTIN